LKKKKSKKLEFKGKYDPLPDIAILRNFMKYDLTPSGLDAHTNIQLALQKRDDNRRMIFTLFSMGVLIFLIAIAYSIIKGQGSAESAWAAVANTKGALATCEANLKACQLGNHTIIGGLPI